MLLLPSGPADTLETANLIFIHAIHSAKERIWIASPSFVPDRSVTDALQLAGLWGVDVRLLIPDKPQDTENGWAQALTVVHTGTWSLACVGSAALAAAGEVAAHNPRTRM